jgi:hypothetical protein
MHSFRTAMRSCIPVPTKRLREIESESCGRPFTLELRR